MHESAGARIGHAGRDIQQLLPAAHRNQEITCAAAGCRRKVLRYTARSAPSARNTRHMMTEDGVVRERLPLAREMCRLQLIELSPVIATATFCASQFLVFRCLIDLPTIDNMQGNAIVAISILNRCSGERALDFIERVDVEARSRVM